MRIAIVHFSRRKVAGAEAYLENLIPILAARGHNIGFWHETDLPGNCSPIALPPEIVQWSVPTLGTQLALSELHAWQPDVLYVHSLLNSDLQANILDLSIPAVFFAHNYYGTCISGFKAFAVPRREPCARRFGAACLALYYPRRCGGLNPLTMGRNYISQSHRLALLGQYARIVVASEHMAIEYARHGLQADVVPLWADFSPEKVDATPSLQVGDKARLIFVGRMEATKGGQLLIDTLPTVAKALNRRVDCHFVGAGTQQEKWAFQAERQTRRYPATGAYFHGWLSGPKREQIMRGAHLLVVPSIWPEPFGLVGLEAAAIGVPATAFAVGGIPQWLQEGVNGTLAPANPPDAEGLAAAIVRALADPDRYQRLSEGALTTAHEQFSREKHVTILERVLQSSKQTIRPFDQSSCSDR